MTDCKFETPNYQLVLASTSVYRQQLLAKLGVPFISLAPDCDETPLTNESPAALSLRLAQQKAQSCLLDRPSLVIGCDQVCEVNQAILGKPFTYEKAVEQLSRQSGQTVYFHTALALYNTHTGKLHSALDTVTVQFRSLTTSMIHNYLAQDKPYDCAGSIKSEGLAIALVNAIHSEDPNSLIGLPLIKLIQLLELEEFAVL